MKSPVKVSALTGSQVNSLLALGLSSQTPRASAFVVEMLRNATNQKGKSLVKSIFMDLQCPVLVPGTGCLSFARLTGLPASAASEFEGKSYLKMLTSPRTSRAALEYIARFAELLTTEVLPLSTRLTGSLMQAMAQIALVTHHKIILEPAESEEMVAVVRAFASTSLAPKSVKQYVHQYEGEHD
jgi:hypothetical protein